jgi:hypothetical protein
LEEDPHDDVDVSDSGEGSGGVMKKKMIQHLTLSSMMDIEKT